MLVEVFVQSSEGLWNEPLSVSEKVTAMSSDVG